MQTYTILMHACMLKKKRRREIGEIFFLKKNNSYLDFDSQNKWDRTILNTPNV